MSKKTLPVTGLVNELHEASAFFRKPTQRDEPEPSIEPRLATQSKAAAKAPNAKEVTQVPTQKVTQISKTLSNFSMSDMTTEQVEQLSFQLRKITKTRVNADIPDDWKDELDDLAHRLRVGKYELMLYLIALVMGKVTRKKSA
jgi:hypothetical protein